MDGSEGEGKVLFTVLCQEPCPVNEGLLGFNGSLTYLSS